MWKGPGQDPGGGSDPGPPPGSSQELSDLKDQFEQQQVLIAQLKEMLRKNDQSNVTQEKVDEYMNTLSKRGRIKKHKKDEDNRKTIDIPASQKISLLRQQVEENKVRLAERGRSQKGIEDMVTQLKAQLDDSQQLISQTPHNLSIQDTKTEYNENSSSQELYMILLTKEKRISDLLTKVQKLESNVLDLQENLKEKDSVIDARTKAITLMTENLSRKGKTTLDVLEETKEQMRKMQEDFIKMESDMKARQMKLLDDLRQKNYEIAELEEVNTSLEKKIKVLQEEGLQEINPNNELEGLKLEIFRLNETLKEKENLIQEFEEKTRSKESEDTENEELTKLKKQLEESNKNMIKVKAQHKSKIKELNKKIDAFKKVSDSNAEIVKLESENCRLNQKIAELEEEKGSLQLKLVESDSSKGSELTEQQKTEFEEKFQDHQRMLEEKDKVISILEAEISRSKTEIETLSEKLNSLSHLENAQVTSEMASIQYEEQMDSLENEKKKLSLENENIIKEKEELLETIEQLKREKQELTTKLEHYLQENMELIDKLEKLSAEKVSSAESIEIVEGLTQQEKLELEAYNKNLDIVGGNMKSSEENLPQVDLNESVNELNEETSELLQRIELFTVERREVMEKMEQLKQENQNLSLKIKEIENNRDVLVETYEHLQSEKELLDSKLETVEAENASLKEKFNLESREEDPNRRNELEEEISSSRLLLQQKESELDNLNQFLQNMKLELEEREKENTRLNNIIIDLNRTLADLENDNKSLDIKITQLEEQKLNLSQLVEKNQEELEAVSNAEWESRRLLESKDNEITKLMKERDNTESVIADLQKVIKEKDERFHKITLDLKDKYQNLQRQLEENSGSFDNITRPLEAKIEEMNAKNKDQLEKMKKIAANLKKKTQAYQELEEKYKDSQSRHEVELKTSLQQLTDLEGEVSRLQQQFDDKCEEVRVLEEKNIDLQNIITDLKMKADKSNEVNLQQELLLTKENLGSVESSLRAKIQELEMIVETQETELVKTRERVNKLEQGISYVEERRSSLERKANELGAQLEEKLMTCEEMSRSEDILEKRLAALIAHDEAIEKKLEEAISDNQELNQQNKKLGEKNEKMKKKLIEMRDKLSKLENQQNIIEELETQNANMTKQIHDLENDLKNLQHEYDRMLEDNSNYLDKINGDWQTQFEEILKERGELMVKCEKFEEELKEIADREVGFNQELVEYKTKLENSETEIRNYEQQIQTLSKEKEKVDQLKQLITERENTIARLEADLQEVSQLKQTIDENKYTILSLEERLHELTNSIEQKEAQISNFQLAEENLTQEREKLKQIIGDKEREIVKLDQQNNSNNLASFFDTVPSQNSTLQQEIAASKIVIEDLKKTVNDLEIQKQDLIVEFQKQVATSGSKVEELQNQIKQLEDEKSYLMNELSSSNSKIEELQKTIHEFEVQKFAQVAVDSVVTEAEARVTPQTNVPVFVWSSPSNDEFDFIKPSNITPQDASLRKETVGNTQEELLDKIKTLEFMLFNTEKEKEEVLQQSQDLTSEVTRLIYEKQAIVESQILQEDQIRDTPELQNIEFEETKPPVVHSLETGPVVEETIEPREAYLCYTGDLAEPHVENVESQVLSETDIAETPETRRELRNLEFEDVKPPMSSIDAPVREEPCSSREAYLCFGENDDGWGWGPEEAKLEEEHAQKVDVETLTQRIRVLEMERENHLEEIRQLQVKSGKLIKKLKEFKVKNEELAQKKKSDGDLFNLDDTIQEELKLQIQQVEKKLKETSAELEKEKNEKNHILKRIDVLTTANEKMVEMKEKQDVELMSCQRNCRDLKAKLEKFEWGNDGFSSMEKPAVEEKIQDLQQEKSQNLQDLNKRIEELNETIKELTLDNEELQNLLEEQRRLRIETEKSLVHAANSEDVTQLEMLNSELKTSNEEKKQLQDRVNELIKKNTELGERLEDLEKQNNELVSLTASKEDIITKLNENIESLGGEKEVILSQLEEKITCIEKEKELLLEELQKKNIEISSHLELVKETDSLKKELDEKNTNIDVLMKIKEENDVLQKELHEKVVQLESLWTTVEEKDNLQKELEDKNVLIESLRATIEAQSSLQQEKEILFKELQEKNIQINVLSESIDVQLSSLKAELDTETKTAEALLEEKKVLTETISVKDGEILRLQAAMEQMTQEWELRINQRGNDVAESWKLHLESRESEFAQIEQLLRKEINELEEKTNALVNENNELRKNVDAEIRNEVDRVAALQQQITDRQQYINELTRTLQEKQAEVGRLQEEVQATKKYLDNEKEIVDGVFKVAQEFSTETIERSVESFSKVLKDKEDLISSLRQELEGIKINLSQSQAEYSRASAEVEKLNILLDERNEAVNLLNSQMQELRNLQNNESENIQTLQRNIYEYQQINGSINIQLQEKVAQLEEKEREIVTLRLALEEKEREHTYAVENLSQEYRSSIDDQTQEIEILKRRLLETEELLHNKDSLLESTQLELGNQVEISANKNKELEDLTLQLNTRIEESEHLHRKIDEQNALIEEENKQLTELRAIIEDQVFKIEQLKKELFDKSNDYDSLVAEMDISQTNVSQSETQKQGSQENDDLTEPVSRAELDLALYMLHQRDVRCEELTVELTQLLEERDTLQLRLSNVIREKEELTRQTNPEGAATTSSGEAGAIPKVRTEVAVDALDPLTSKLSELRSVSYKKDKTLVDEQEIRRFQQLSIMQQHRDAASKLPPEAAARLVDASYTLSRDVQSPSKVLLNWLWGRSTPRVNNI